MTYTNTSQENLIMMERAVFSALLEGNKYEDFASMLKPDDFFYPSHRLLFSLCGTLYNAKKPVDASFLDRELLKHSDHKTHREALAQIMATSSIANLEAYIRAIQEAAIHRRLLQLSIEIREQCSQDKPSSMILDEVERALYQISIQDAKKSFRPVTQIVYNTMKMIEEAKLRGNNKVTGLDTGFRQLNEYTGGFQKGDLVVIGARPSMGKTSFVLNIAQTTLTHNQGVAIFSMEMSGEQLMMRLLSSLSALHLHDLKMGNLTDPAWENLSRSAQNIAQKPLFIDDSSVLTIQHVRSKMRQIKNQHPEIAIAIVDYLQLMSGDRGDLKRHEQVAEISRGLKTLARELDIPILALSQLNRSLESREDKRPILSDLKESGAIEQDADQVLFLYRDAIYKKRAQNELLAKMRKEGKTEELKKLEKQFRDEGKLEFGQNNGVEDAEIILAKNRNGSIGTIKVGFNKAYTRFEDRIEQEGDQKPTNMNEPETTISGMLEPSYEPETTMPDMSEFVSNAPESAPNESMTFVPIQH
ncbi:replicative DNA helicase [Helicobacter bizzozeronii]|uniref:replicative DNA helicase n=1 Tax=Helicobacter bizzozeronii TaxID=56877 RepID=UPI000CF06912|nr:replicative DNA helicase [Helicobacter bizzozeronii]